MSFRDVILKRIQNDKELPTLPTVFTKVSGMLNNSDASAGDIAKVMRDDPALTTKILKVANSAVFGGSEKVASVALAVARLGFKQTADIVMSLSALNLFQVKAGIDYRKFWTHSLSVAFTAEALLGFSKNNLIVADTLFTSGILHDIGMMVLDQCAPDIYKKVLKYANQKDHQLHLVEKELLGITHAEVGAVMLAKWQLPEEVIQAVGCHHTPLTSKAKSLGMAEILHLANFICNNQGITNGVEVSPDGFSDAAWFDCGIDVEAIPEIIENVQVQVEKSEVMMAVAG